MTLSLSLSLSLSLCVSVCMTHLGLYIPSPMDSTTFYTLSQLLSLINFCKAQKIRFFFFFRLIKNNGKRRKCLLQEHFLLFPQCFKKASFPRVVEKVRIVCDRVNKLLFFFIVQFTDKQEISSKTKTNGVSLK